MGDGNASLAFDGDVNKDGTVSMIPRQDLTGSSGRLEEFTT